MKDGRIPKDIICGELALWMRTTGRPHLRYKDVCIRDMKAADFDTVSWEGIAAGRSKWSSALRQNIKTWGTKRMTAAADKRARRKDGSNSIRPSGGPTTGPGLQAPSSRGPQILINNF